MKILIVKLSSIGDVIHTLPVLPAIKEMLPEAEISWVVEKNSAEILKDNPMLSRLIVVDTKSLRGKGEWGKALSSARQQIRGLQNTTFDIAIDFQGLLKSATIAKFSKAKKRYGFAKAALREPASRFLLTDTFEVTPQTHIIKKNLALASKALKILVPEKGFVFPIATNQKDLDEAALVVEKTGENFAILNPAGGWPTKLWAAEKYGQLADKLWEEEGLASVITIGPREKALGQRAIDATRSGKVSLAAPSLKGFYELAKRASIYIGGDTGPTHLAVAAGAPIVGIFGPTEWWRNGSPNPEDICVERVAIGCRVNCHRRSCSNWICMDIEVDAVLKAAQKRIRISE